MHALHSLCCPFVGERANIVKNNHKRRGRIMKRQLLKISSRLFVVILFSLMTGVALAEKKHWFVVKDKGGMCRVIEAETVICRAIQNHGRGRKKKGQGLSKGSRASH